MLEIILDKLNKTFLKKEQRPNVVFDLDEKNREY